MIFVIYVICLNYDFYDFYDLCDTTQMPGFLLIKIDFWIAITN